MPNRWSSSFAPERQVATRYPMRDVEPTDAYDVRYKADETEGLLPYLRLMKRRKWVIAGFVVLGALTGVVISQLRTPIYEAHVSMEVQNFNQEFLNVGKIDPTSVNYEADSYLQTQMKMIQSDGLLDRVVAQVPFRAAHADTPQAVRPSFLRSILQLPQSKPQTPREKAIGLALSTLRVRGSGMTRLIEVYCDGTDPQFAADFCNTLATEFLQQSLEVRWNSAQRVTNWLTEQLAGLKNTLQASEERLNEFQRSTGVLSASDKDNAASQRLLQLQDEMFRAQADRVSKQSKYEMAMAGASETLPDVLDDPSLREYQMRFVDLRRQYAELSSALTPNHPQVKRIEAQLNELNVGLKQRRANILTRIHNEFDTARRRESLLDGAYQEQLKQVAAQTSKSMQFNTLKRDVDSTRDLYESMLRRFKEAGVAAAMRVSNIRVVDSAKPPESPDQPDRKLHFALGITGGLLFGIAFVLIRESNDSRLKGPGDAKYYLDLPELGLIPAAKVDPGRSDPGGERNGLLAGEAHPVELVAWQNKRSLAAESYRSALTSIMFYGERTNGKRPQVVLLTSPGPQDGKTTTLCNLGISLAGILCGSKRRVLLIDGDFRRPRLHRIFEMPRNGGFCDLLRDGGKPEDCPIEPYVRPTKIPGLWVLPSGNAMGAVTDLIHSNRLRRFLNRFRHEFDAVLVDAPPMVSSLSDARVLARSADAVILVVRSGHTCREVAMVAREQLRQDGTPLLGTILNDWNPKKAGTPKQSKEYLSAYVRYYQDATD
jgi:capsular exopolysaccharide synthesis family protein